MSWVRVESSGGHRYAAPSHGRLVPNLEGMALLFQAPFRLRQIHTFSTLSNNAPAISCWSNSDSCGVLGTDESVNSCVMVDQRNLGGRLGLTTVAVGDEEDVEVAATPPLRLLLDRVFAVLCITTERGVQVMLDALCTRAPPPLTTVASAEAAIVQEDDGGRRVPPALWLERSKGASGTSSNRQFLMKVTHGCSAVEGVAGAAEKLSLQPLLSDTATETTSDLAARALTHVGSATANAPLAHSSTALSMLPEPALLVTRPPLSYAAALRRRSLLFFVPQGVVPLSLLAFHLQLSAPAMKSQCRATPSAPCACGANAQKAANTFATSDATATDDSTRPLHAVLLEDLEHVRIGVVQARGCGNNGYVSAQAYGGAPLLHCVSHLRQQNDRLLKKSSSWAAVARTAEESGRVLVWAIARLLGGAERPMRARQAADLERLILHDLWALNEWNGAEAAATAAKGEPLSAPPIGAAPLVAVYSPSGLLLASARFSKLLNHEEQVLLAAVAIDRLARYAPPQSFSRRHARAPAADALRWTSWPMHLGEPANKLPDAVVVDVLLITVGDALAFCLAFPRTSWRASAPPVTSLQLVQSLLETTVAKSRSLAEVSSTVTTAPLAPAFVSACTHSTAPYTPTFHDALFAVTALEDALDGARKRPSDERLPVAQHLHQLLLLEASQLKKPAAQGASVSAVNAPASTTGKASIPPQASVNAVVAVGTSRDDCDGSGRHQGSVTSALHKIFSCLPLRHNDPRKDIASSRQLYITAAQQQSTAYVNQLDKEAHLLSSVPVPNVELAQCSNPYAAYLLAMPLEEMLCYVSALVTRNELGALRPSYELGLHSFFFLQRPAASAGCKRADAACVRPPAPPTRFVVSFARFRLQQSPCTPAVVPEEWAEANGAPDGSGGRLTFFEDPSLLLRLNAHGFGRGENTAEAEGWEGDSSEAASEAADRSPNSASPTYPTPETQVSVVPVWTLLQVAPAESLAAGELGGLGTETSDSDSAVADGFRGVHRSVPSSVDEDAQLVTSLHYSYMQRLRHREPPLSRVTVTLSATPPSSAQQASSSTLPNAQLSEDTLQAGASKAKRSKSNKTSATETWCQLEAVITICGDIAGTRQSIVTKALQRHALSTFSEQQLMGRGRENGSHDDAVASGAMPPNSLPAEWEYAADAPHKMADLCRELVWCQEAALALLEGASCST